MLNERELLWRLLLGGEDVARHAAASLSESHHWLSSVQLAFRWKALPDLNERLSMLGASLPAEARDEFRMLGTQSFLRSAVVARRGAETAQAIASDGISVAVFKGLAVLVVAGGQRQDRTLQDVDMLVDEADVVRCVQLLENRGYSRDVPGDIRGYFKFVRHSPGFAGNEAVVLTAPGAADVDLHWRVGPRNAARFESAALLSRARPMQFKGMTVQVVGTVDGALLTVHHSLRNNFVPDDIVRDLLDLETWIVRLVADDELIAFAKAARECSLLSAALAMAGIVARVRPGGASAAAVETLEREATQPMQLAARRIEELFFVQLRDGPLNPDLLYLMRRDTWKLILGGALTGWSGYREQMQALEMKKHGATVSLTGRLGRLVSSAVHTKRKHWVFLRMLAEMKAQPGNTGSLSASRGGG